MPFINVSLISTFTFCIIFWLAFVRVVVGIKDHCSESCKILTHSVLFMWLLASWALLRNPRCCDPHANFRSSSGIVLLTSLGQSRLGGGWDWFAWAIFMISCVAGYIDSIPCWASAGYLGTLPRSDYKRPLQPILYPLRWFAVARLTLPRSSRGYSICKVSFNGELKFGLLHMGTFPGKCACCPPVPHVLAGLYKYV